MQNNLDLSLTLVDSIDKESLTDLVLDQSELLIDTLTDNDALKEIPVFGTLYSLYKVGTSFRDSFFRKKIEKFLLGLSRIPLTERVDFVRKVNEDPAFKRKLGDVLVISLERYDDIDKPELLANALIAYVDGKINFQEFILINKSIESFALIFRDDFCLYSSFNTYFYKDFFYEHLTNCNLVRISNVMDSSVDYRPSHIGELFFKHVLNFRMDLKEWLIKHVQSLELNNGDGDGLSEYYEKVPTNYRQILESIENLTAESMKKVCVYSDSLAVIPDYKVYRVSDHDYFYSVPKSVLRR